MTATRIDLTTGEQVQGTLPVANGGTGAVTLTGLLKGAGTSAVTAVTAPSGAVVGTTDTQTLAGKTLTTPVINGYSEGIQALGTVTASPTIGALSGGTVVTATLTSATPATFAMPTVAAGLSFSLCLRQPASGTATTATFTGVKWPAAGAPTITATVGKADLLSFICPDGSNWYGSYVQGYTY
jgi:hypothetical protein